MCNAEALAKPAQFVHVHTASSGKLRRTELFTGKFGISRVRCVGRNSEFISPLCPTNSTRYRLANQHSGVSVQLDQAKLIWYGHSST